MTIAINRKSVHIAKRMIRDPVASELSRGAADPANRDWRILFCALNLGGTLW